MKLPGPIEAAAKSAQERIAQQNAEPKTEPDELQQPQEPSEEPKPEPQEDWKKRFSNYKSSTDVTINDLRSRYAEREDKIATLTYETERLKAQLAAKEQAAKQPKVPPGVLNDEDLEVLGEDNVERFVKLADAAADRKMSDMRQHLSAVEGRLQTSEQARQRLSEQERDRQFWNRVRERVPNVDSIDADTKFRAWLTETDPISGQQRKALGIAAKKAGDVERMISLYSAWPGGSSKREDEVVPVGSTSTRSTDTRDKSKRIWRRNEYQEQVNKALRSGPITPAKQKKLDALYSEYLEALRENRVR